MTLFGLAGLTATHGSTSAFTYTVPGPPMVHAANGLGPDARTSGPTEAATPVARTTARAAVAASSGSFRGIAPPFLTARSGSTRTEAERAWCSRANLLLAAHQLNPRRVAAAVGIDRR